MRNPIMDYDWGSTTAIPELLGIPNPDGKPMAEMWMGAHPKAPSQVEDPDHPGQWIGLDALIARDPERYLGADVARRFGGKLPFLFKVLAAAKPLSIQVHPNLEQAREGFARENAAGIPLSAPHRNYKDDNHKPELICALTPFHALVGFKPPEVLVADLEPFRESVLGDVVQAYLAAPSDACLRAVLATALELSRPGRGDRRNSLVEQTRQVAEKLAGEGAPSGAGGATPTCPAGAARAANWDWIRRIYRLYPGDVGVFVSVLLNYVCLEPGEAVFLGAGNLHAYLEGTGVELMANSDNVLRGGLTSKHVDVDELLRVVDVRGERFVPMRGREESPGVWVYETPAPEFELRRVRAGGAPVGGIGPGVVLPGGRSMSGTTAFVPHGVNSAGTPAGETFIARSGSPRGAKT